MKLKKIFCLILLYTFFINNTTYIIYAETETSSAETSQNSTDDTAAKDNQNSEEANTSDPMGLQAEAAILIDADTGIILYDKNPHEKLYPASITKILTSLLVIEYCEENPERYNEIITHSHNAVYGIGYGSSHIGMREGEQITIDQALHGVLLRSANEVCMALAEHIDTTVDAFVEKMNNKAKKLGALDSHFANPHGFHDENHYTSAYDMSLIMKEAIKHEKFVELISTKEYRIPPTNIVDEQRYLDNTNKLIWPWSQYYYKYCVGSKTGFTDEAGNTLVTYAQKDGISLISVVMKDQGTTVYTDTIKLLDSGFEMYSQKELFNASTYVTLADTIQEFNGKKIERGKISVIPRENINALVPNTIYENKNKLNTRIKIDKDIKVPVEIGDEVGNIEILYNGIVLGSTPLISNTKIDEIDESILIKQEKKEMLINFLIIFLKIVGIIAAIITVLIIIYILVRRMSYKGKRRRLYKKRARKYELKTRNH